MNAKNLPAAITLSLVAAFLLPTTCAWADAPSVPPASVTVTDAATGAPAAGVRVARGWLFGIGDKPGAFQAYRGEAKTGADGAVPEMTVAGGFYPSPVFAYDEATDRGAWGVIPKAGTPVSLSLAPLAPVRFKLRLAGWKGDPPFLYLNVGPEGAPHGLDLASATEGTFRLPPGRYTFSVSSPDVISREVAFTVPADDKGVNLGTLTLELGPLAKRYGQTPPPLTVTDGKGVSAGFSLDSLRGKWVLIDFWGFWCPPCVSKSLPNAMKFWDEHAADRDRFAILTFHCLGGVDTAAQLAPAQADLEKRVWNRPLPFPVLLDRTGSTLKDWGITIYPYTVLLDPEGRVVRGGSLERLAEELRQGGDKR